MRMACRVTVGLVSPMGLQGPAKSPLRAVRTNQALSSLEAPAIISALAFPSFFFQQSV